MPPPPRRWWCSFLLHFFLMHAAQSQCTTQCGGLHIPFPFYLNSSSCPTLPDAAAFSLSCINSSSLFLTIASHTYRILHFFPDGVLLDFPNTTLCRHYNDLRSFPFSANQYFAISTDNFLDLYDCEDSSLCKPDCEKTSLMAACDGRAAGYPSCCYPLSDHTSWRPSDSLSEFSKFGCRGFSSWVVSPGSRIGMRGIKLEWAVPSNSTSTHVNICAANANVVNSTAVPFGIRCRCLDGFSGDGFSAGVGCRNSACLKDGKEVDCYQKKHGRKKAVILAGVLTSTLCLVSFTALFLLKLKRSIRSDKFISEQSEIISDKAFRPRLFSYHQLHEATQGFGESQRLTVDSSSSTSTLYAGVLQSGSLVAIQKLQSQSETDLIHLLFRLETLSAVSHKNMARIVGWCIDAACAPMVVYDYPGNGTFREHLRREENAALEWHMRLSIAAETACILAFLHHEISPPIYHHDLQSGCIFLDADFSVKLAGFELHSSGRRRNDVYSMGLVLVEMITGKAEASATLQKIKKGKVEEVVDPRLYYHEQTAYGKEQIEIAADLAMRCLLFGGEGKVGMGDVARELVHLVKESVDGSSRRGPALEETFSNSSLLQMISMSPDSIYLP